MYRRPRSPWLPARSPLVAVLQGIGWIVVAVFLIWGFWYAEGL